MSGHDRWIFVTPLAGHPAGTVRLYTAGSWTNRLELGMVRP
jgi:hypothetical protein